jgi:enoyl-CoA hydratase/carnithine racemase
MEPSKLRNRLFQMQEIAPVLFTTRAAQNQKHIGIATLNRAKALNALNLEMCEMMLTQFRAWQLDESIAAVVLRAEGEKAFCAGGDVAEVVKRVKAGGDDCFDYGDAFFSVEYALDLLIHQFGKPFIALAQGITMGGGMGLVAGASHRIVSTGARIAMPEIHIGLFPDVGGGFFLNRLPCRAGWLLALTGQIVNEHDVVLAGLANAIIPAAQFEPFLDNISQKLGSKFPEENRRAITDTLNCFAEKTRPEVAQAPLWQRMPLIHEIMHQPTVTQVRDALLATAEKDEWFAGAAKNLANGSPTTAHVAFEYLQRSLKLSISEVLAMDLVLAKQFPRHHDFLEGVRAVLIDKDKTPHWSPARFEEVETQLVAQHFSALE